MRTLKNTFLILLSLLSLVSCNFEKNIVAQYNGDPYTITNTGGKLEYDQNWIKNVYKGDEDFVILNLTDIQLGTTSYLLHSKEIFAMIDRLVNRVQPDLITITGDFSYGCSVGFYGICSHLNSYGILWAPVLGNHDFENSDLTVKTESEIFQHYSNCIFADGPKNLAFDEETNQEALGNYVVNIIDSATPKIIRSLIFINSGQDGITSLQQDWYVDCIKSLPANTPSTVFLHIPTNGFYLANKAAINSSGKGSYWKDEYESSFGYAYTAYGPSKNDGFMEKMIQNPSTDLMVCGHFHKNSTCIKYKDDGITYLYSLKTGSGHSYLKDMCGGTSITVKSDGSFKVTHIYESL